MRTTAEVYSLLQLLLSHSHLLQSKTLRFVTLFCSMMLIHLHICVFCLFDDFSKCASSSTVY